MQPELVLTDEQLPANVIQAIKDGRKIEAIKMLREASGLGLANAKVLVDRASRIHGPKKTMPFAVKESSGNGKLVVSIISVMILVGAYYYIGN
jgi:ribosomal protein L7/L12